MRPLQLIMSIMVVLCTLAPASAQRRPYVVESVTPRKPTVVESVTRSDGRVQETCIFGFRYRENQRRIVQLESEVARLREQLFYAQRQQSPRQQPQPIILLAPQQQLPLNPPQQQLPLNPPQQQLPLNPPQQQLPIRPPQQQVPINPPQQQLNPSQPPQELPQLGPPVAPLGTTPIGAPQSYTRAIYRYKNRR